MNNLEICERMAKIEGKVIVGRKDNRIYVECNLGAIYGRLYEPLTDKALCFDLMVEYDIKLSRNRSGEYVAMYSLCRGAEAQDPQKAVCLAIIEANEDKNKTTWLRDSNTHSNKGK